MRKLMLLALGVTALVMLKKRGKGFGPLNAATVGAVADELLTRVRGDQSVTGARPSFLSRLMGRAPVQKDI